MLSQEWFSPSEIAALALPGMPGTKANVIGMAERGDWQRGDWKDVRWRQRTGRGGGIEYHYSVLPQVAQIKLTLDLVAIEEASERETAKQELTRDEMWKWFEGLPEHKTDEAKMRLEALDAVRTLVQTGLKKTFVMQQIAAKNGIKLSTFYNWEKCIHGVDRVDWLPYLAPRHVGKTETVECHPDAWEFLKANYLRLAQPAFEKCYRDLTVVAAKEGWNIPSGRTLQRRIDALSEGVKVLTREGQEAIKRIFPAQERDRSVFHALQAVNADGHKWDVFVKWPDGQIGRVMMVAFQDLYSGKMLSYRLDRSENKEAVRLAFGDLVEKYGIPDECLLDNGRAFASKWLSGGIANRYRFKVKEEDPDGIMKQLGVTIHWATPYHGQAKPIERGFRDFAGDIAKDMRFEGAYTGNSPTSKPENYGSKAIPFDLFAKVVAEGVAEHNARIGRKAKVCAGRSFDTTFAESYEKAPIRKATPEQRRLWLLAAESIMAARVDGSITMLGNRYWSEFLHEHRGQKLVTRFDPQQLQQDLHVYRLDGSYLGAAKCVEAVGFFDVEKAREHASTRGAWLKATKARAAAEVKMSLTEAAALLPEAEEPEPPESKVVRLVTRGNTALQPIPHDEGEEDPREAALFEAVRQTNLARRSQVHLRAVPDED